MQFLLRRFHMKSLQQFRRFILSLSLSIVLSAIAPLGCGVADGWAVPLSFSSVGTSQGHLAVLFG
jgi:hypothetical protein